MKSKSLNSLSFILISAVVLFAIAIFWKLTQTDNSEVITIEKPPVVHKNVSVTNIDISTQETATEPSSDVISIKPERPPLETREAINKYYKSNYQLARLRTPEDLVKAYKKFRDEGNYDMADKVIVKLDTFFPDYKFED